MNIAISIFTTIWGIYTLVWFIIGVLTLYKLKRVRSLIDSAQKDLDTMSSILAKFKRAEMPLDASIIESHMKLFDAVEQSFNAKMELYKEVYSK